MGRNFEVETPILNSAFDEPARHWRFFDDAPARAEDGRRPAHYFYRDPRTATVHADAGTQIELELVNRIRDRLSAWRELALAGKPGSGVTATTRELLAYWRRPERRDARTALFFAQLEAAETIIFLTEARADFLQGIRVEREEPGDDGRARGFRAFQRYCCKMATGSGKSTVMAMLAAWSILNKRANKGDARFSDAVVIVCPNVTIRDRLGELDPARGEASLYRTRDLVPPHLMSELAQGRLLITNWHAFEPQAPSGAGDTARVNKAGVRETRTEYVYLGERNETARGKRYLTPDAFDRQRILGMLRVLREEKNADGSIKRYVVETERYVESDTHLVDRVLGAELKGRRNVLVFNDEAHHAYRIRRPQVEDEDEQLFDDEEDAEAFYREATIWVDGLDRVNKLRGINVCIDFSATPYYLGRVGQDANRPFPWIVSDFGLVDAIESGLVKIPQFASRDNTGAEVPAYFNIWEWVLRQMTGAERGGRRAQPNPAAVLKYAHVPIAMLYGRWREEFEKRQEGDDPRPPVFIIVCKNTALARTLYEWIALDQPPTGIPSAAMPEFRNRDGLEPTIRVDSKVSSEVESEASQADEKRWMRFTLDTVGRLDWPRDRSGNALMPTGFAELAAKLGRPLHPPGRDVRCIISVGMLTEGWDCNTVTHIVGLRPFMSQLLCEQVVGRGLRRMSYEADDEGKFAEEAATVFGVPFSIVPFKSSGSGPPPPPPKRFHVRALPEQGQYLIRFPRVEGYTQRIGRGIRISWDNLPRMVVDPNNVPVEVQTCVWMPGASAQPNVFAPAAESLITTDRYGRRVQEEFFKAARALTMDVLTHTHCQLPAAALFPQMLALVRRCFTEGKIEIRPPATLIDAFYSPWYGWLMERLLQAVLPLTDEPEVPRYEQRRGAGTTADVDFWTSRPVAAVAHSHVNFVAGDTKRWEQACAFELDKNPAVRCFVKNAGLERI